MNDIPPAPQTSPPLTTWPLVLGIISLVFGIGALFMYGCVANVGMAMVYFLEDLFRQASARQPAMQTNAAQMEALKDWAPATIAVQTLVALVAIVLVVGGTKLVRRRPGARAACLTWAVLRILIAIPSGTVGYLMNQAMFEAMQGASVSSDPMAGTFVKFMGSLGLMGAVFGLVWAWAYPVFLIVWLSRGKIREEMKGWEVGEVQG